MLSVCQTKFKLCFFFFVFLEGWIYVKYVYLWIVFLWLIRSFPFSGLWHTTKEILYFFLTIQGVKSVLDFHFIVGIGFFITLCWTSAYSLCGAETVTWWILSWSWCCWSKVLWKENTSLEASILIIRWTVFWCILWCSWSWSSYKLNKKNKLIKYCSKSFTINLNQFNLMI